MHVERRASGVWGKTLNETEFNGSIYFEKDGWKLDVMGKLENSYTIPQTNQYWIHENEANIMKRRSRLKYVFAMAIENVLFFILFFNMRIFNWVEWLHK